MITNRDFLLNELVKEKAAENNPHVPGAKDDKEKPDLDLVLKPFSRAIIAVGEVGTLGAKKYTEDGWLEVKNGYRRYSSAMQRHYFYEGTEGLKDRETRLYHAAHCAWNALARLELQLRELDDLQG